MAKITVKLTDTTAGVSEFHRVEDHPEFNTIVGQLVRLELGENAARDREDGPLQHDAYCQPFMETTADGRTYRVAKVQR